MKVFPSHSFCSSVFPITLGTTLPIVLGLSLSPHFGIETAQAQIVPDQSTATEVSGNRIAPVGAGTVSGGNLYHSFDQFNVPNSGVVFGTGNSSVDGGKINNILNRVTGDNPSQILGTIESRNAFPNANLYLMNPNGVVFGQNARLDIGGSFHVNTGTSMGFAGDRSFSADKSKLDFPSGDPQNIKFAVSQPATIINQGNLTVDVGKSITFTAGAIVNSGALTAPNGNVSIASVTGGSVVDLRSPDLVLGLSVLKNAVPTNWNGEIATLPKLAELLTGKVEQGDRVVIKPDGTLAIVTTPTNDQLPITNGTTVVSGTINASSINTDGGKVGIFGDRVALINSQISATGINGGTVLIGGDLQGNGVVPNAQFTYFDNKSIVDVSALTNGNGGKAIVWGDRNTQFLGTILSKGGAISGDGGFVEVSGKVNLAFNGIVNTLATNGKTGTLLLDPTDITVVASGGSFPNLASVDNSANPDFLPNTLNVGLINGSTSNVTLAATNNININTNIAIATSGISFTAQAGNDINFANSSINTNRGNINLISGRNITGTGVAVVSTQAASGNSGSIDLQAGGSISGLNFSSFTTNGVAGNIKLQATGNITVPNTAGLGFTSGAQGSVGGVGNVAGNITITSTGGSIVTNSDVSSGAFTSGKSGDIVYNAAGNITTAIVDSRAVGGATTGGNITLTTTGGSINTSLLQSSINASGVVGKSGSVFLQATGNITSSGVRTGDGGNVTFITSGGAISTTGSVNTSPAFNGGNAGNITFSATNGNITIDSSGLTSSTTAATSTSGSISLNALNLAINGVLDLTAQAGKAGSLILAGNLPLTTNTTFSTSSGSINGNINLASANITGNQTLVLNAGTGNISLGAIGTSTAPFNTLSLISGSITLNKDIYLSNSLIFSTPVTFANTLTLSSNGSIAFNNSVGSTSSISNGTNTNISLQSRNDINVNAPVNITAPNISFTAQAGNNINVNQNIATNRGSISLLASTGSVLFGTSIFIKTNGANFNATGVNFSNVTEIDTTSSTGGGNIDINVTGSINANPSTFLSGVSSSRTGNAGNITLKALGDIQASALQASDGLGATVTNGGNVTLDAGGNITIGTLGSIATRSTSGGKAGDVLLKSGGSITALGTTGINTSVIGTATSGSQAGNVTFQAGTTISTDAVIGALINSSTITGGNSGIITLTAGGTISATGDLINANLGTNGNAGKIDITSNSGNVIIGNIVSGAFGTVGDIKLTGAISVSSGYILGIGGIQGGNVSLTATSGNINIPSTALIPSTLFGVSLAPCGGSAICTSGLGGSSGNITLNASGTINVSGQLLTVSQGSGSSGNISFTSGGNLTTGFLITGGLLASGTGRTGDVTLTSTNGNVTTTDIIAGISAVNSTGNAGNIAISARGNVNLISADNSITSATATGSAGKISITSQTGAITATGDLSSGVLRGSGNGNDLILTAAKAIAAGNVGSGTVSGNGSGGNIEISGESINVTTLGAGALNGVSGKVTLTATNDITAGLILNLGNTKGGDVLITSTAGGTIQIPNTVPSSVSQFPGLNLDPCVGSNICTAAKNGIAGNITIAGNLLLNSATKFLATGNPTGGAINLQNANINGAQNLILDSGTGEVNLSNIGATTKLGTLTVNAGSILANQAIAANTISFTTTGNITTQILDTSITGSGNSGNISLKSTNGNVTFAYLNTSVGTTGNAGNVTIDANGDIRSTSSFAAVGTDIAIGTLTQTGATTSNAGNITLTSTNGKIDISTGEVNSSSGNGNGGIVSLKANSDINLRTVATITNAGNGGNVSITSDAGAINFRDIISDARVDGVRSGKVDLKAFGDITNTATTGIAALITKGNGNAIAGDITIESTNGNVAISGDRIDANADSGNAGNIKITSQGNLTINSNIESTANSKNNGNVTLTSNLGTVILNRDILARDITITSATDLTLPKLQTNFSNDSGNITVNSGGQLFLNGNLDTSSTTGTSGSISLTAARDIFANGEILLDGRVLGGRDSKAITVISQTGNITGSGLLDVFTSARNAGSVTFQAANSVLFRDIKTDGSGGIGGNVTITATSGNITGNSILATSQNISTGSGNVSLTAGADIAIKQINSNTQNGKAGDISVKTALSSGINGLTSIQANSITGQGGNITLESGSTLPNAGLTILAGGAIAGSTIDLRTASLLIGGDLIINSPNSDILLGRTSVQPFNFKITNARNVTLSQRLLAESVDITNTGILKFTDANTLIESPIFQQQSASEVQLAGEIRGTTITFNSPVVLTGNAILTASDFGITQGTIAFNSTLNGGGRDLKLSANELDFGNNVSGINALTLAPSSAGVNIQLGGIANVAGTFTLTQTDLLNVQAGGLGSLIIGGDFGAQISIVSPIPTFLQKTTIQADGFGNIDSVPTISQGSIVASVPVAMNGSDIFTFIASQNVNIGDVTNAGKDIIVTSTNANVITGKLTTTATSAASGNVTVTASKGSVSVNSIVTQSPNNKAGDITIQALNNIQTTGSTNINGIDYAIAAFTNTGNGGNVSLTSTAGGINVSSGKISTTTSNGTSGSVNFKAAGDIITGTGTTPNPAIATFINTGGTGTPNSITFTSDSGAINTTAGDIDAGGGAITFTARNNITTSGVFSRALNGGTIKLESQSGAINTTAGDVTTTTLSNGTGGNISLLANSNINTRGIFASGSNGKIAIASQTAGINTTLGELSSVGNNTSIDLTAPQDIITGNIFSQGDKSSLTITSDNGTINTSAGTLQGGIAASQTGNGGAISLKANGAIIAGEINTPNLSSTSGNAGSISLISDTGTVTFTAISARRNGGFGNGGAINIQANGNITSTGVATFAGVPSIYSLVTGVFGGFIGGNGGAIALRSNTGSINTQSGTVSTSVPFGNAGDIALTSDIKAIATGDLTASGYTKGGNISVIALEQISTGQINSSSIVGAGGNVLLDPIGNVTFSSIDATGFTSGGNINIVSTGGNVLGTGILTSTACNGATICTNNGGTLSIQHGISAVFDPNAFLIGGATTNGTAGNILVNGALLTLTPVPNGAGPFTFGNVTITPGGGVFIPPITPPTTTPTNTSNIIPITPIIVATSVPVVSTIAPGTLDISDIARQKAGEYLAAGRFNEAFNEIEKGYISQYENYLGETLTPQIKNIEQLQEDLEDISNRTGSVTTAVYPIILKDRLEILIIPPKGKGKPFREFVAAARESEISPVISDFANNVRDVGSEDYLEQAQQLYNWLVRPYEARLQEMQAQATNTPKTNESSSKQIEKPQDPLAPTLVFVMDGGLRVIPVAALHDGKQYLVEKYALANIPYLRASRLESRDRRLNNILAMGLTESIQGFAALPSVKVEVSAISSQVLQGDSYLDQDFTVSNLQNKRRQSNFAILHLATHAQFTSNTAQGAFIQFWNERLSLDRIPSLRFDSPLVEMLTLSACQTAVGQNLGLGGLAVSSGAKSVLASLWEVSDAGTAPLMVQFYNSFPENVTKAIALQRAQIEILQGKVTITDGKIIGIPKLPVIPLTNINTSSINIKHPFFWSSFILIGNWL